MGDAPPPNDPTSSTTRQQILPVPTYSIPYWRTELHAIDSHRSSESLPTQCDIAIIGAGMAGVTTAYHICKQLEMEGKEPSIVMLEAREVCSGATGRNGVSPCMEKKTARSQLTYNFDRVTLRFRLSL
jgi:ribulose 1,5-bisphosphate synthetase/thiazole synthase